MGWGAAAPAVVRAILTAGGIAVALVLALKIGAVLLEPRLAFFPLREYFATPSDLDLPFEDVNLRAEDGVRLHGWFVPSEAGTGPGSRGPLTLLLFHGNAENIGGCLDLAELTRQAGYNLLLVDYRGYGESEGRPSEAGLYRDGRAAFAYLKARPGVRAGRIVLWGRSIGAAVAVKLAAADAGTVAGVILESPFTSVPDLLRSGGHWVLYAASRFGTYRFDSVARIGRVRAPLLVVHGTADDIAPFSLGRRLFDLAPGPKRLVAVEGGGHNDLWAMHADEVWDGVRCFLESLD